MSNGNRFRAPFPINQEQLEQAKMEQQLLTARQKDAKARPYQCLCGNRVFIKQTLVEVARIDYPKVLGLDKPEVEIHDHMLSQVYICSKCMRAVVEARYSKLLPLTEFDDEPIVQAVADDPEEGKAGVEDPQEHIEGSKEK